MHKTPPLVLVHFPRSPSPSSSSSSSFKLCVVWSADVSVRDVYSGYRDNSSAKKNEDSEKSSSTMGQKEKDRWLWCACPEAWGQWPAQAHDCVCLWAADKDVCAVEKICGYCNVKGKSQWHVKWLNFEAKHNTWKPMEHRDLQKIKIAETMSFPFCCLQYWLVFTLQCFLKVSVIAWMQYVSGL